MNLKAPFLALLCGALAAVPSSARSQVIRGGIADEAVDVVVAPPDEQSGAGSAVDDGVPMQGHGNRRLAGPIIELTQVDTTQMNLVVWGIFGTDALGSVVFANLQLTGMAFRGMIEEASNTASFNYSSINGAPYAVIFYKNLKIETVQSSTGKWEYFFNNLPVNPQVFQKNKQYSAAIAETQGIIDALGWAIRISGVAGSDLLLQAVDKKKNLHGGGNPSKGNPDNI